MVTGPEGRGGQQALWLGPVRWLWAARSWIAAVVGICLIAATVYVLWAIKDLPDPNQDVLAAGDVIVLDRNGKLIEDWNPAGHYHINLQLNEMGPYAAKAVMAAEDRSFYSHGAIDLPSTLRALMVDVSQRGFNQGGSTITQQLVKIQLLKPEKSLTRKLQEVVLAIVVEQRYSKDQILTMYLNRVYFGHGAYGVGAAHGPQAAVPAGRHVQDHSARDGHQAAGDRVARPDHRGARLRHGGPGAGHVRRRVRR